MSFCTFQGIHVSSDIFQTLCVTPDAMCFDQAGTVCFLDLYIGKYSEYHIQQLLLAIVEQFYKAYSFMSKKILS